MANQHPLDWPADHPRAERREKLKPFTDYPTTSRNVERALSLFEKDSKILVTNVLVTSNYTPSDKKPEDPGVAVYFTWDGRGHVIAADRFERLESNLISVYYIIQARRTELRLGSLSLRPSEPCRLPIPACAYG